MLAGCVGLVMLKRWALYIFAVLAAVRLLDVVSVLIKVDAGDDGPMYLWLPLIVALALPIVPLLYCVRLTRTGMLR